LLEYINSDNSDDLWNYVKDESYYQLGVGYQKLKETNKAKEAFQKSLELNPTNEKAKKSLGNL
jgi:tetratricopeptide (TPR) repeat protein